VTVSASAKPNSRGAAWFWVLLPLTVLWLLLAGALSRAAWHRVDCAGRLQLVSEPRGWQAWPKEAGRATGENESELFGFGFSHHLPRGFWYGGYEDSRIFDPQLCPDSSIDLDGWLRTGEGFWLRNPSELWLYRDPRSDVLVIAGRYGFDLHEHPADEPPHFVTAFRRELSPRHGWEHAGTFVELPFGALGLAGLWVIGLRLRRSPRYARWVVLVVLGGLSTLGVSVTLVLKSAAENMR